LILAIPLELPEGFHDELGSFYLFFIFIGIATCLALAAQPARIASFETGAVSLVAFQLRAFAAKRELFSD
jgi:hypothetical protein